MYIYNSVTPTPRDVPAHSSIFYLIPSCSHDKGGNGEREREGEREGDRGEEAMLPGLSNDRMARL